VKKGQPLKILYVGLHHDYGDPRRGLCYEYVNLFGSMAHMEDIHVGFFPVDDVLRAEGRTGMNRRLIERVAEEKPDICFFVLFTDEISMETIRIISHRSSAKTLNWFCDDHWRFGSFSKFWAPQFHWVVTTDRNAVERYHTIGVRNVIRSQWGFSQHLVISPATFQDVDVSFVGQVHSGRRRSISRLSQAGINVQCWGKGWNHGRIGQEEMSRLFGKSKINLNFAESSNTPGLKSFAKVFLNRRADDSFHLNSFSLMVNNSVSLFARNRSQIKARNFEIPGHGGFLLTSGANGLEEYYTIGKEIVCFESLDDLVDKIRFYLLNDKQREAIRKAGQQRTLRDHTYNKRIHEILHSIDLK
jgi:spore maturation protein CgeB